MDINELIDALNKIKSITKRVPASDWTPEFREIANIVHRTLRDHTNVAALRCESCGEHVGPKLSIACVLCIEKSRDQARSQKNRGNQA